MTTKKIVGLTIAVSLIAAGGCSPLAGPSGNPAFELAATDLPANNTMMVYKVENPAVTIDSVEEIGDLRAAPAISTEIQKSLCWMKGQRR